LAHGRNPYDDNSQFLKFKKFKMVDWTAAVLKII